MSFDDKKDQIDEFVKQNGVGAHVPVVGYTPKGKKKYQRDKNNNIVIVRDDNNVYLSLVMMLYEIRNSLINATGWNRSDNEIESVFDIKVYEITALFDPNEETEFINYFIDMLKKSFQDAAKKDTMRVPDKENPGKMKRVRRLSALEQESDDGYVDNPEVVKISSRKDSTSEDASSIDSGMVLATNIIRFISDRKKNKSEKGTQDKMYRIFFTEGILHMMYGVNEKYYNDSRHTIEVFENLDGLLLNYLLTGAVTGLKDLIYRCFKTISCLSDLIGEVTSDEEYISVYKKRLEDDEIRDKELNIPKCPFHSGLIEAYLYYGDCRDMSITGEEPRMHSDSYVIKYRKQFKELISESIGRG